MTTMNPLNGMRPRQTYMMPPEFTNNNYLAGPPNGFSENLPGHSQPQRDVEFIQQSTQYGNEAVLQNGSDSASDVTNTNIGGTLLDSSDMNSVLFLPGCADSARASPSTLVSSQVPNNLTMGGGNFTFTSPTQSTFYSPSIMSSTMNRYLQPRMVPQAFAPTSCLQWQHTVPQRIPWSACSQLASDQDVSQFTGSSASDITFTTQSLSVCSIPRRVSPVPSCSQPRRRLKRQAPDTISNLPSKVHLTEDMISKHMQGLQLENVKATSVKSRLLENGPANRRIQWQKFHDLEDRLSLSEEEEDAIVDETHPRLHIADDIAKMVNNEPVVPKEIMDKISNPRMELVLWTPPGDAIKDVIKAHSRSSQQAQPGTDSMDLILMDDIMVEPSKHTLGLSEPLCMEEEDGSMEIE